MGAMKATLGDDLFSIRPRYPQAPGFKEATTSRDAAEKIGATVNERRAAVLREIASAPNGLTADEVASRLGLSVLAVRPRVSELKADGKIVPTGERRPNSSGLLAKVMRRTR